MLAGLENRLTAARFAIGSGGYDVETKAAVALLNHDKPAVLECHCDLAVVVSFVRLECSNNSLNSGDAAAGPCVCRPAPGRPVLIRALKFHFELALPNRPYLEDFGPVSPCAVDLGSSDDLRTSRQRQRKSQTASETSILAPLTNS